MNSLVVLYYKYNKVLFLKYCLPTYLKKKQMFR